MSEKLDIISIGESLIELSSDKSLTYAQCLTKYYGGDTLCAAVTAARLGSYVGYISRVGNDFFKDFLLESWQLEGLDTSQVKLVEGFNGLYFIAREYDGEKEFSYYRKKTAATKLSIDDIAEEYIKNSQSVYTSGITQSLSLSAKEAVEKACKIAKENSVLTAYDPNFDERLWSEAEAFDAFESIQDYLDIIFLNRKQDGEKVFGIDTAEKLIKYFWDRSIGTVVVKSKADGGYFVGTEGSITFVDFWTKDVVDTTCSGDAFNGAFLHGYVSGLQPVEAAKLAAVTAGLQCQGIGAVKSIPDRKKVEAVYHAW